MDFQKQFDLLWSVESISHYEHRKEFLTSAAKLLKPGVPRDVAGCCFANRR